MKHTPPIKTRFNIQHITSRITWCLCVLLWLMCDTRTALAVQTHGAPEGLYAHQIAHFAFLIAMVYIWLRSRHRAGEGWRLIRLSFVFFAVWNLNTLIAHAVAANLDPANFQGYIGPFPRYFVAHSFMDIYFFFGKMDHFLCIPAVLCLGLGLKQMRRTVSKGTDSDHVY